MDRVITDNSRVDVFCEINRERIRQDELHPWDRLMVYMCDKIDHEWHKRHSYFEKGINDANERNGVAFIDRLMAEELHEAFAETDPVKQREELIQLAALCVKVIEKIDRESKENA